MEIKVGEYVRTKHSIGKVENIGGLENELVYFKNCECLKCVDKTEIKKHSPNIIDLIELGDFVNGYLINYIPDNEKAVYHDASDCMDVEKFENKDIETIVTKEQFKGMEYKV